MAALANITPEKDFTECGMTIFSVPSRSKSLSDMAQNSTYRFPEQNPFRAREVLDTDFDIDRHDPGLYVDLEAARLQTADTDYRQDLFFMLNIDPDTRKLETPANDFSKILFLGHRGCGKTIELRRIQQFLHHPDRYFSVHIEVEKELEVGRMQPEDFYIIMLVKTIRALNAAGIGKATKCFDSLLEEWLSEKEVQKEIVSARGAKGSAGVKVDTDGNILAKALSVFKFDADLKATLSRESKTTTTLRTQVSKSLPDFIVRFNNGLFEIRELLADKGLGRDIMFILDGTEKTAYELYESVFQKNGHIFRELNANLVTTLRLDAFYRLEDKPNLDFFQQVFVPMVEVGPKTLPALAEIIRRRVDAAQFFEEEALAHLVEMSGGSIRQLLRLANQALLFSRGKKVGKAQLEKLLKKEAEKLFHALSPERKAILQEKTWVDNWAHPDVSVLLFSMVLLKYNGNARLNPLLQTYFEQ